MIPHGTFKIKVGDGSNAQFWKDTWLGDVPLEVCYNRLFRLDSHPNCFISDRFVNDSWQWSWSRKSLGGNNTTSLSLLLSDLHDFHLGSCPDFWHWNQDVDGRFTISGARRHIDDFLLPSLSSKTRWYKFLPRKVNIFLWRLLLDRLPTRLNLPFRGIEINSIIRPFCCVGVESRNHFFLACQTAKSIWHLIRIWVDFHWPESTSIDELYSWLDSWNGSKDKKDRLHGIIATTLWWIWRLRNDITCGSII